MSGECIPNEASSIRGRRLAQQENCLSGRINHLVERGNQWIHSAQLSDLENYFNGQINLAFVDMERRGNEVSEHSLGNVVVGPIYAGRTEDHCGTWAHREVADIRQRGSEYRPINLCVVHRWDKQAMLVQVGGFPDQEEQLVPTRFTVGPKTSHGTIKACPSSVGISVMKGFQELICFGGKGELGVSSFLFARAMRRDDFPVDVVESGSEIVNRVPANQGNLGYNGFVFLVKAERLPVCASVLTTNVNGRFLLRSSLSSLTCFEALSTLSNALTVMAKIDPTKESRFQKVIQTFLTTPHEPHKPKSKKKASPKRKSAQTRPRRQRQK